MADNSKLFEKYILNNNVEVPERLVIPPLTLGLSNPDGTINKEETKYLKVRAKDIGLYILGAEAVNQEGIAFPNQPRIYSENDIESNKERARIIKSQGALAINQIHHGGYLSKKIFSGLPPAVPSADIANEILKKNGEEPIAREFTDLEIKKTIEDFANATELSIKAGYDGIEIHGANNYLLQQFYSPFTNRRTDEWGGSDEKRMNFPLKVVDACCKIREKCNRPDFIIGYRLSPEEPFEPGITMTETIKLIKELVKKIIKFIHISQKNYFQETRRGEGKGTPRLQGIHEITKGKVALIGVGGLRTQSDFTKAINSGFSEFIAAGVSNMINKDLGTLLKENKGDKQEIELDPEHPEKYEMGEGMWNFCISEQSPDFFPPVKGKTKKPVKMNELIQ
jgi:2,4-dienoyl-CoA reductase-like NADH-dependent reductase (Old Yellow Enzyme family)